MTKKIYFQIVIHSFAPFNYSAMNVKKRQTVALYTDPASCREPLQYPRGPIVDQGSRTIPPKSLPCLLQAVKPKEKQARNQQGIY